MRNVPLFAPNLKINFSEKLIDLEIVCDVALDEAINKPTAINLRLP